MVKHNKKEFFMTFKDYTSPLLNRITPTDNLMRTRIETCKTSTIPSSLAKCYETGRIDAFKRAWKEGDPGKPHIFWDSDVAKVLEGVANILALYPDSELEKQYDDIVELIISSQEPDGYLNSYFTVVEPERRWENLCTDHELYCAGHLIEAAVAGYELLGKKKFLDAMCRYADYIDSVFGREEGKKRGYPGHEELELALIRLYNATGRKKYLDLAEYFVNERGQSPNYFTEVEHHEVFGGPAYQQAHIPLREQREAVGHAVRAVYLYAGAADVAKYTGDAELFAACEAIMANIVNKRMYITGGIGSSFVGETFTCDYDLPVSSMMYAESCAAIGLVRFASRMLNFSGSGRYADIMERSLFNGVLCGVSLDGDTFNYTNYLEVDDNTTFYNAGAKTRQKWFDCSCCPTNFCRFLPEMLQYIWSENDSEIRLNIPVANTFQSKYGSVEVKSLYPYDGAIAVEIKGNGTFTLALHLPEWSSGATFTLNGEKIEPEIRDGYVYINRTWQAGDRVEYVLPMEIKVMRCHHKVTGSSGRIALTRGPLVYACETVDNPDGVSNLIIPAAQEFRLTAAKDLPAETVAITGRAYHEKFTTDDLYTDETPTLEAGTFTAIPYALWQNRGEANMAVWIRSC